MCGESFVAFGLLDNPSSRFSAAPFPEDVDANKDAEPQESVKDPWRKKKEPTMEELIELLERQSNEPTDVFLPFWTTCPHCKCAHHVTDVCTSMISKRAPHGVRVGLSGMSLASMPKVTEEVDAILDSYEVDPAKRQYVGWCLKHGANGYEINLSSSVDSNGDIVGRRMRVLVGGVRVYPFRTRLVTPSVEDEDYE